MFSLESPQRGNSNEYTQYTIFNIKKKITLNDSTSQLWDFFQGTQELVRNSRGKRAISVRATEVLLYLEEICIIRTMGYALDENIDTERQRILLLYFVASFMIFK